MKINIATQLDALTTMNSYALIQENIDEASKALEEARTALKARKMEPENKPADAHSEDPSQLIDRYEKRMAAEFFRRFFKRVHAHHIAIVENSSWPEI